MKHSWFISIFLVGSLLGLLGCSEEIAKADNKKAANVVPDYFFNKKEVV